MPVMTWALYSSQLQGVGEGSDESLVPSTRVRHDHFQPRRAGRWSQSQLLKFDGRVMPWPAPSAVRACAIRAANVAHHAVARRLIDLHASLRKPSRQTATAAEDSHA